MPSRNQDHLRYGSNYAPRIATMPILGPGLNLANK